MVEENKESSGPEDDVAGRRLVWLIIVFGIAATVIPIILVVVFTNWLAGIAGAHNAKWIYCLVAIVIFSWGLERIGWKIMSAWREMRRDVKTMKTTLAVITKELKSLQAKQASR